MDIGVGVDIDIDMDTLTGTLGRDDSRGPTDHMNARIRMISGIPLVQGLGTGM